VDVAPARTDEDRAESDLWSEPAGVLA
jgi:hypothetical protein